MTAARAGVELAIQKKCLCCAAGLCCCATLQLRLRQAAGIKAHADRYAYACLGFGAGWACQVAAVRIPSVVVPSTCIQADRKGQSVYEAGHSSKLSPCTASIVAGCEWLGLSLHLTAPTIPLVVGVMRRQGQLYVLRAEGWGSAGCKAVAIWRIAAELLRLWLLLLLLAPSYYQIARLLCLRPHHACKQDGHLCLEAMAAREKRVGLLLMACCSPCSHCHGQEKVLDGINVCELCSWHGLFLCCWTAPVVALVGFFPLRCSFGLRSAAASARTALQVVLIALPASVPVCGGLLV